MSNVRGPVAEDCLGSFDLRQGSTDLRLYCSLAAEMASPDHRSRDEVWGNFLETEQRAHSTSSSGLEERCKFVNGSSSGGFLAF